MFPVQPILRKNFISTGASTTFSIPSGPVKVEVYDLTNIATVAAAVNAGAAITALYQSSYGVLGMTAGSAYAYNSVASGAPPAVIAQTLLGSGGYTFVDSSIQSPGAAVATTAVSAAAPASVSTLTTAGLIPGVSVVRMINVIGMEQISSFEFTVGTVTPGASFTLANMSTVGFPVGAAGFYRIIPNDPIYYPRRRFITNISAAANCIVTLSVTHGYTVGQAVRLIVPTAFGMSQANGLLGTIVAIGASDANGFTNTITLDIDTSAFTTFAFPTTAIASAAVSLPEVTPVGEAAINSVLQPFGNLLDDATRNLAIRGVSLGTGVVGAAGHNMLLIAYSGLIF